MSAIIEMHTDSTNMDLRVVYITMSRVPSVGEGIRVLSLVHDITAAFWFVVNRVEHNANVDMAPKRVHEIDAWIYCTVK